MGRMISAGVALVVCAFTGQAQAQPSGVVATAPPEAERTRDRLHLATGLGVLVTKGGLHLDGDVGWHLAPNLVAGGTFQFYSQHPNEVDADFLTLTGVFLKWWPVQNWWIEGSAGLSRGHWSTPFARDDLVMDGSAAAVSIGREIISRKWFSFDIRGEYFVAKFDEGESHRLALSLGFGFD